MDNEVALLKQNNQFLEEKINSLNIKLKEEKIQN
jgi:hypothetical protein